MIYFVTPAFQRYELSEVCLEQRRRVIDRLASEGIEARCVVIADDDNLDIARSKGFDTVERDNEWLGRKFNDGIEYAAQHGAEWIVPIGSDSWIDPAYFLPMPNPRVTRTSGMYSVVNAEKMAELNVGRHGAGPYIFHRKLLRGSGFRPANDELRKNIDHSTIKGIGQAIRWRRHDLHPLQYIGFRGTPHITRYDNLLQKWGTAERTDPWDRLKAHYPADLVDRARAAL